MRFDRYFRLMAAGASLYAMAGAAVSCSDSSDSPEYNETAVLYIQNAGEESEMIELLEPQTYNVDMRVCASTVPGSLLNVSFEVAPSFVDAYNEAHGTGYGMLPGEAYDMTASEVMLPKYNQVSSTASITLKSEGMDEEGPYILPVVIGDVKGDCSYTLDDKNNVYYILLKKKVLPAPEEIDRSGMTILFSQSEFEELNGGIMTGVATDLLDGNPASYWCYNWSRKDPDIDESPFHIVIDMGQEISFRGIRYMSRQNKFGDPDSGPRNAPEAIRLDLAQTLSVADGTNDSDWTYSEEFTALPDVMENTLYVSEIHRARYLRFVYVRAQSSSYKGGDLAEIYVLGNYEDILQ